MQSVLWRIVLTLAALTVLAILGPVVSCSVDGRLLEQALNQTPQAQIDKYLAAVAEGDRRAALALWSPGGTANAALEGRREAVTDALLAYGPRLRHQTLDIVWWRTCCEPGVIEDPDDAGGARVRVAISSEARPAEIYIFDVLVPGGYWGEAAGRPVRQWAIVDIYPEDAAPLAWTWR